MRLLFFMGKAGSWTINVGYRSFAVQDEPAKGQLSGAYRP
jgi:hypothetical protein